MKGRGRALALAALLLLLLLPGAAGAGSVSEEALGEGFELEVQVSPSVKTETLTVNMGGEKPRPGQKRKANVVGIDVPAMLVFESPFSVSEARLYNPADATAIVVYQLRISVAELLRQAGITGYGDSEYEALSAAEGFEPERSYIVLSQTKGIPPGSYAQSMALGTLPSGQSLPAGRYQAELVMVPFDPQTRQSMMLSAVIGLPFVIESDLIALETAGRHVPLSLFNPVDAERDLVYSVQLSQAELERVSGSPHRTEAELLAQKQTAGFDAEYEFISLYESEPVPPGGYLEGIELQALPDGGPLPAGEYTAWLVRYGVDASSGEKTMLEVNTQLRLLVR